MSKYAANTSVSSEKSRAEIERTLRRYGADQFAYATSAERAMIGFQANGRRVRFDLDMPDRNSAEITRTPTQNRRRSSEQIDAAWEQACRQRWRALALCVKAKLEAVESDITTFDAEFMAHIVLPNGRTVGDTTLPAIAKSYETGTMPRLLEDLS